MAGIFYLILLSTTIVFQLIICDDSIYIPDSTEEEEAPDNKTTTTEESMPPGINYGILAVRAQPRFVEIDSKGATVTFRFTPPCPNASIELKRNGETFTLSGNETVEVSDYGNLISISHLNFQSNGNFTAYCKTVGLTYLSKTPLKIGVKPRILSLAIVRGYSIFNLTRFSTSNFQDHFSIGLRRYNIDFQQFDHVTIMFTVACGHDPNNLHDILKFSIPQFEANGKFNYIKLNHTIDHDAEGMVKTFFYILKKTDLENSGECQVEGFAIAATKVSEDQATFRFYLAFEPSIKSIIGLTLSFFFKISKFRFFFQ